MPSYENFSNVKSTVRTLRILELFENTNTPLSLTDTCKKLNIPKSSAYAIISTLVNEGYLEKISSKICFKFCFISCKRMDWWF